MNKCEKCQVNIYTSNSFCPLCKNKIDLINENDIFPKIKSNYKKHNLLKKNITANIYSKYNNFNVYQLYNK